MCWAQKYNNVSQSRQKKIELATATVRVYSKYSSVKFDGVVKVFFEIRKTNKNGQGDVGLQSRILCTTFVG